MEQTTDFHPMRQFDGGQDAWLDAYAHALGAAKPTVPVGACVVAARAAWAAYDGELHPYDAAQLDAHLGPLLLRSERASPQGA